MALTKNQAADYDRSDDLIGLGMEADTLRRRLHPEDAVTYIIEGRIQYASLPGEQSLDVNAIYRKIAQTIEAGGTGIVLQGYPDCEIAFFKRLLQEIRQRFPQISLVCFPAAEVLAVAAHSEMSLRDTLASLRDAGLDSIPGDGARILGDEAGRRAGQQCSTADWLNVHRTAHQLGMRTTAAMAFGKGETFAQRLHHLDEIRRLQEETGGFTAFLAYSESTPENPGNDEPTAVEYLKMLAIARLHLDTIANMQCSWMAQGLKVLQLSLRFGGNDAGSLAPAGKSLPGRGTGNSVSEEQLRHVIRGAGFRPIQRDALYATCFLN